MKYLIFILAMISLTMANSNLFFGAMNMNNDVCSSVSNLDKVDCGLFTSTKESC